MKSLLRLKPYLRPHLWLILLSGLLAIPLAALSTSPIPLVQQFINSLEQSKDLGQLRYYTWALIAVFVLNFFVRFAHYFSLRLVIVRVDQKLKNDLFDHLLGLSSDVFSEKSTGNLMARVTTDPNYVSAGLAAINTILREPLKFFMALAYALYLNWRLTLLMIFLVPPLAWVFSVTGRLLKRYIQRVQEVNGRLFSTLQESFTGIRIVKAFKLEKYVHKKFRDRSEEYAHYLIKTSKVEEASHPAVELFTALVIAGVLFYGGREVILGNMRSGDLMAFFVAFGMMIHPLRLLNDVNIKLNQAAAACDRIFEVFSWQSKIIEKENPVRALDFRSEIRFQNVRFAYPDHLEREILKGVNFSVNKGKTVAIVGASGAGKSSLISLLPRLFDVTGGAILVDGVDIRDLRLEDLRRLIAIVNQDVFLFNDTIEQNIRCGKLSAERTDVLDAAERAHATDFIEKSEKGFQTVIGDRGMKLSGGERQRISIARAFLRDAPILILDEATSSLDSQSELAVQAALDELMKNKTTIVIAHRLSTIRRADHILVLKDGQVVEEGRHDDLLKKQGEYFKFNQVQGSH